MARKYITTPIYYVNDKPHIGHAYTTIAADVLARHFKSKNDNTFFLTGTDEHGAKIAAAAQKAGKQPQEFVDYHAATFQKTWEALNIEYSKFIRTSDSEHEKVVTEFVANLKQAGFVEKRKYSGLYCIGCEKYLSENDLVNGLCPDHKTKPVEQSEENYFFLLSKFQDKLIKAIEKRELEIKPGARRNEVLGKLRLGLEDVSISRASVKWGIPFPGDSSQTIYVWVDALINYYSATRIYKDLEDWRKHPADVHLMAKDILWFHAVIWPAMLMALKLPLPKMVFAHGFFTISGEKMSKSRGNVLDPIELSAKYGADALRYALLREFPFGEDGDFSEETLKKRYESDLANSLGNLLQRVLVMINKYNINIKSSAKGIGIAVRSEIESLHFDSALILVWDSLHKGNENIDKEKPWELAKSNTAKLQSVLHSEYNRLTTVADALEPFMPSTAKEIKRQLKELDPKPLFPKQK